MIKNRLLVYNMRYAAGNGRRMNIPMPGSGYLRTNPAHLEKISQFVQQQKPDLVGLLEVDTGSKRTGNINQAEKIAKDLGHYSLYQCKYHEGSFTSRLPILNAQANAFIASNELHHPNFHYFNRGVKRLIIELETDEVCVFLVHLSLWYRHRQEQLWELHQLMKKIDKPVIIAGDFNTYWGSSELNLFKQATGLLSANKDSLPTFPSDKPRLELDFVLYEKPIQIDNFTVCDVQYSDHRPLVVDFSLNGV
ncbi:MAG: endonuclease [Gammaproteobacteria bacterium]|nr:endonuclease/exonuclease/phosphatase family protein [Gammaproteobacteria bacterium]NNC96697.1 endonuclease [Gammaproteobacteria bacterium]NNM13799.1 endonuclease [Gammaproteobacteria bacterium]